jgi:hypothetical protein
LVFWSRFFAWKVALIVVKPATLIVWHRKAFTRGSANQVSRTQITFPTGMRVIDPISILLTRETPRLHPTVGVAFFFALIHYIIYTEINSARTK